MTETAKNTVARQEYEQVKIKVMKVTLQGVLCASIGGVLGAGLSSYNSKSL